MNSLQNQYLLNFPPYSLDKNDVRLNTQIQPRPSNPLQTIEITFVVDGISQEFNETFSIKFASLDLTDASLFPNGAPVTLQNFSGTIIDQDSKLMINICINFVITALQELNLSSQGTTTDKVNDLVP